jgi:hypothetical protein
VIQRNIRIFGPESSSAIKGLKARNITAQVSALATMPGKDSAF